MFICADHGNAEQLIDEETGEPFTAHTTNQVPFILVNADPSYKLREGGCLADIAPTLIEMMGMEQPKEMTGKSLIVNKDVSSILSRYKYKNAGHGITPRLCLYVGILCDTPGVRPPYLHERALTG